MRALLLAPLLLAACKPQSDDGYTFERKEWNRDTFTVTIVEHPSREALVKAANLKLDEDLQAYSVINAQGCTIHTIAPTKTNERVWIGHELAHCAWGQWHPSRGGRFTR